MSFKKGDVVVLKSGSLAMVVTADSQPGLEVTVTWMTPAGQEQISSFDSALLILASDDKRYTLTREAQQMELELKGFQLKTALRQARAQANGLSTPSPRFSKS